MFFYEQSEEETETVTKRLWFKD